jgi:hypothetical protein
MAFLPPTGKRDKIGNTSPPSSIRRKKYKKYNLMKINKAN